MIAHTPVSPLAVDVSMTSDALGLTHSASRLLKTSVNGATGSGRIMHGIEGWTFLIFPVGNVSAVRCCRSQGRVSMVRFSGLERRRSIHIKSWGSANTMDDTQLMSASGPNWQFCIRSRTLSESADVVRIHRACVNSARKMSFAGNIWCMFKIKSL